jgi:putative heme-binding domain-containing protein
VNLASGPDGALYVCDMYRAVVEHPAWLPSDIARRIDFREGADRGRVWRVAPPGSRRERRPFPAGSPPERLARELESADAWRRGTAHRLLLERGRDSAPAVRDIARKAGSPLARVHAAHLLDALGAIEEDHALSLLADPHPRLRESGAAIAERWLPGSASIRDSVLRLAADPDPAVRFQAALSLGAVPGQEAVESIAAIAILGAGDRWTRLAAASGAANRSGALLRAIRSGAGVAGGGPPAEEVLDLARELAQVGGARGDPAEIEEILGCIVESRSGGPGRGLEQSILLGLAQGVARRGERLGGLIERASASTRDGIRAVLREAGEAARDPGAPLPRRLLAIELTGHAPGGEGLPILAALLAGDAVEGVRAAAARALGARPEPDAARLLVSGWSGQGPPVRRAVIDALLGDPAGPAAILGAIEDGTIAAAEVPLEARRTLAERAPPGDRGRARDLLGLTGTGDRQAVIARYREALGRGGKLDRDRARGVFEKHCAACHRVDGVGIDVGPGIADIQVKSPEAILEDILDPSRAIDQNHAAYTILLRGGGAPTGLIASESASSVTLRRAGGETETVLRIDIEEIRSSGLSLMPDGFEKAISPEDMAELVRWLRERRIPE